MATESERNDYFNRAYHQVMRGGEIQAFVRQGFNELGAALKAFPDSIQVDQPGQVFNPIYHDMVEDRKSHDDAIGSRPEAVERTTTPLPSPGEIAGDRVMASTQQQQGSVHGRTDGGIQGPERGVYGPEHGVYGRDNGTQAAASATGKTPTPGEIADGKDMGGQQDRGNVHGQEAAKGSGHDVSGRDNAASSQMATPGEIADGKDLGEQSDQGNSRDGA